MKIQFTFYLFLLICFTCQAQKPNNSNNKLNYYIKKSQKLEKKKKFEKASFYLEKFVLKTTHKDSLTDVIEKISELKKKAKLYNHLYTAVLKSNGLHAYNQLKEMENLRIAKIYANLLNHSEVKKSIQEYDMIISKENPGMGLLQNFINAESWHKEFAL